MSLHAMLLSLPLLLAVLGRSNTREGGTRRAPPPQGATRLSAWETRAGWRLLFDGLDASAWSGERGAASIDGGWLVPPAGGSCAWRGTLGDFELELVHRASAAKAPPVRLRAVASGTKLEVWDGTIRFDPLDAPAGAEAERGPLTVRRDPSTARWHLALRATESCGAFRDLRVRELASLPGERVELLDGRSLAGWKALGDARWSVDDGALVGEVGGGKQSFLVTERTYGDFLLDVDVKNERPGNSGIQVRSRQDEQGRVRGYQVEIDPSPRAWSGGLYDEGRRGWLADLSEDPLARAAFRPGEWNHYRIECVGPHLRTWVNGTRCVDALDPLDAEGFIGLQVHSGRDTKVRWKDLVLRDLGRSDWKPLTLQELGGDDAPVALLGVDALRWASAEELDDFVLHARRAALEPHVFALGYRAQRRAERRAEPLEFFGASGVTLLPDGWRIPLPDAERSGPATATALPEDLWIVAAGTRVQVHAGHRRVLELDDPRGPARGHVLLDGSRRDGGRPGDVLLELRVPPPR